MQAHNPSEIRTTAHQAMALATLHINSSLTTRFVRNVHASNNPSPDLQGGDL